MRTIWKRLLLISPAAAMIYGIIKPLPKGLAMRGKKHKAKDLQFLYNLWYEKEEPVWENDLYLKILKIIEEAESFIVLDQFLFNDYHRNDIEYPRIAENITEALVEKKKSYPDMKIVFITDPVNTAYGAHESPHLSRLEANGVEVIMTDLRKIRDSNPIVAGFWRAYFQWFGTRGYGWLPHAMSRKQPSLTLRSYLKMLNLKANHRKIVYTDREALISSFNPHDASAYFNNIGFAAKGNIVDDGLESEQAVAAFSGGTVLPKRTKRMKKAGASTAEDDAAIQLLTEGDAKRGSQIN
ncbi:hypothetical protein ACE1TI_03295 [Alteribacillus sp. JSM 102045]|uniref:hypothetical protein n=1 Tax=Alteribacillus sp. JSM 102045 TaxID=1562101 RepID=UPI0035BF48E6